MRERQCKLLVMIGMLVLCCIIQVSVRAEENSGICGDALSWSFTAGTLTISGSGEMDDYAEPERVPWYTIRDQVLRIELPDGMTSVGDLAFYECENLSTVVLPDTVTKIGDYAFSGCDQITLLNLGSRLQYIGEGAFSGCSSLLSVRLPDALQSIGIQAFYRCESLTAITVPKNVRMMGTSAFGYCKSLIRAEIQSTINVLPEWTFIGCENLVTVILPNTLSDISTYAFRECDNLYSVYYGGSEKSMAEIKEIISADVPSFGSTGYVGDNAVTQSASSGKTLENLDGTITQTNTSVQETENSSVVFKVEHTGITGTAIGGSYTSDVTVTIENSDGWTEAKDIVLEALKDMNDLFAGRAEAEKVEITVYVKENEEIDTDFMDAFAGRNLQITVVTEAGSVWEIDCKELDKQNADDKYNLSYQMVLNEDVCDELRAENAYELKFSKEAQINARVKIRLPLDHINQTAVLFQREEEGEFTRLQAVVVDNDGYATFYLASVSNKTEYYIGINIADIPKENVIVPEEMFDEYGGLEQYQTIEYVVTGHKSSWGMTIGQVTWIMVGVLAGTVVIVGVIMGVLNKRKLKQMNYVKK